MSSTTTRTTRHHRRTTHRQRSVQVPYDQYVPSVVDGELNDTVNEPLDISGYPNTLADTDTTTASGGALPATEAEVRLPGTSWRNERVLGDRYEPLTEAHRPVAYNEDLDEPDITGLTETGDYYDAPVNAGVADDTLDDVDSPSTAAETSFRKRNYQNPVQAAQPGEDDYDSGLYGNLANEEA